MRVGKEVLKITGLSYRPVIGKQQSQQFLFCLFGAGETAMARCGGRWRSSRSFVLLTLVRPPPQSPQLTRAKSTPVRLEISLAYSSLTSGSV